MERDAGIAYSLIMAGIGTLGLIYCGIDSSRKYRDENNVSMRKALKHVFYDETIKKSYDTFVEQRDKNMRGAVE